METPRTPPIARVGLARLDVPLKEPHPGGSGERPARPSILVAVETEAGAVGLGECSPPPADAADDRLARCWDDLAERLIPGLLGRTVDDLAAIASLVPARGPLDPSAVAGVETACWDVLGQQTHRSLAQLLWASDARIGAGVQSGLAMGLYDTVVDLLRAIEPHLAEGYGRLTLAIAPGRDLEFVEAVLQHYPELVLALDAGGRFGREHADVFRRLDGALPLMIHRPYPDDDLDGLAALQAELVTPLCLDATATEAIRRGACRMARLSVQRAGGLGPARALHDFCREHGVDCCVSSECELGVGVAQAIHLATLPSCKDPTDIAPPVRWAVGDVVVPPIEHDAPGQFLVPTRPGLGHLLDPLKVRRYQVRHEEWVTG